MCDGFQRYDHVWLDMVSKTRLLVADQTAPMIDKVNESQVRVNELSEQDKVSKERIALLEQVVFKKDYKTGDGRFKVLDDIWEKLAQLECGPAFAQEKIKLHCVALVKEELEESK